MTVASVSSRRRLALACACLGTWLLTADAQQPGERSPAHMFQEGVALMESRGDCRAASLRFTQVAEAPDRALAARALLYLGTCHERLGRDDADRPYRRIVDEFSDQMAVVREARVRLARLARTRLAAPVRTTRLQRLWPSALPDLVQFGATTPSGRVMAYVDRAGGVALVDVLRGQRLHGFARPERGYPGLKPVPAPDGTAVVFPLEIPDAGPELHHVTRAGASRALFRAAPGESLMVQDWPRPGQLLLEVTHADRRVTLGILGVSDAAWRPIRQFDAPIGKAALSPDGRFIAYDAAGEDGRHDLWVMPAGGGPSRPLVTALSHDRHPMWHGLSEVVFVSDRTGTDGLWVVDVDAATRPDAQRVLVQDVGRVAAIMGLGEDGRLLYARQTGMVDVFVVALDADGHPTGRAAPVATSYVGSNLMPTFSPIGRTLAFLAQMGFGTREVVTVHDLHANSSRQVVTDMVFLRAPVWSPDGRAMLVKGNDTTMRFGFHRLDPETGQVAALKVVPPQEESSLGQARWTRDGRVIYSRVESGGRSILIALEPSTSRESPLLTLGDGERLVAFAVSPLDDTVAMVVATTEGGRVEVWSPGTNPQARTLVRFQASSRVASVAWDAAGRRLLVAQHTTGRAAALAWVPLDGGQEPLGIEADGLRDVAVSPDGRFVAYTAGYPTREPWMVDGFLPGPTSPRPR